PAGGLPARRRAAREAAGPGETGGGDRVRRRAGDHGPRRRLVPGSHRAPEPAHHRAAGARGGADDVAVPAAPSPDLARPPPPAPAWIAGPLDRLRTPRPPRSARHAVQAIGLGIAALGLVLASGATALSLLGAGLLLLLALRRVRDPQALPLPIAGGAR